MDVTLFTLSTNRQEPTFHSQWRTVPGKPWKKGLEWHFGLLGGILCITYPLPWRCAMSGCSLSLSLALSVGFSKNVVPPKPLVNNIFHQSTYCLWICSTYITIIFPYNILNNMDLVWWPGAIKWKLPNSTAQVLIEPKADINHHFLYENG